MCGISGIIGVKSKEDTKAVERMVASLSHRGPDGHGILNLGECQLGHTRLSIIDLEGGVQPMKDASERYAITFNGEIYNYQKLREELLKKGHRFNTHSDTEVIMSAYAEWGTQCLDRFRGMFAFAIWDTKKRTLFAGRDLFGEKPLYYAMAPTGSLLFASEIKALLASDLIVPCLDLMSVDAFLAFGYVPPDRTIYQNVHSLPPGHYFEWDDRGLRVTRYWNVRFDAQQMTLDDAAVRMRELLQQAVQRQTVADVPVGAFLSGGHDSSTIVALMQQLSSQPVKTFSVGFGEYINELPYARAVAELYRTEHHDIDLGTPPVAQLLQTMAEVYDEPFRDPSHIPTYLISQYARGNVKVVLTGDGADELFGGYAWYPLLAKSTEVSASWFVWLVLRSVSRLVGNKVRSLDRYSRAIGIAVRTPQPWRRYIREITVAGESRRSWWAEQSMASSSYFPGEYYRPPASTTGMDEVLYFDLMSFLPGDILVKVDRAAMAHGLETRAPFLDRDLVEFSLSLPSVLKVKDDETKVLFKHALKQYWPALLHKRGKQGFAAPFQAWLEFPEVRTLSQRVFADGSKLRELLPGVRSEQQHGRNYETWNLLTLGLWLERHGVAG
ncbi:MAG: asparagine synthase (glutamine-hydrolyzing) [Sulfuricaulis sp.]|uniref:asparagine synthase (glutamine-hydrolyzing) n=1 Tax=Sulfuricaulis sp. TaxID=2003553 RepID=UPI0034A2586D